MDLAKYTPKSDLGQLLLGAAIGVGANWVGGKLVITPVAQAMGTAGEPAVRQDTRALLGLAALGTGMTAYGWNRGDSLGNGLMIIGGLDVLAALLVMAAETKDPSLAIG